MTRGEPIVETLADIAPQPAKTMASSCDCRHPRKKRQAKRADWLKC